MTSILRQHCINHSRGLEKMALLLMA